MSITSDEGIGAGASLSITHKSDEVGMYRDRITGRAFVTSRFVQRYELRWDGLEVGNLPLRLQLAAGLYSTAARNYCGLDANSSCNASDAQRAAEARGLENDEKTLFIDRYYLYRFFLPQAEGIGRWAFLTQPIRLEGYYGWRGGYHLPGDLFEGYPYPGSRYTEDFPAGERGSISTLLLGIVADHRDRELLPRRGMYVEAGMRGGTEAFGSEYEYVAFHAEVAGWAPIDAASETVFGARWLLDAIEGEVPVDELARSGGLAHRPAFGGQWLGRGIRSHRFPGRGKFVQQAELRAFLFDVEALGRSVRAYGVGFVDFALVVRDWRFRAPQPGAGGSNNETPLAPRRLLAAAGAGLRFVVQDSFVLRLEVAVSPEEDTDPLFYAPVGEPF
ncbi:MAG: BamA/TamA family outer membrane protein [Myxococcota bacterium]